MGNPAWGTKRTCQSCEAKYYDLGRTPVVCPKCQTVFDPASGTRLRSDPGYKPTGARAKSVFGKAAPGRSEIDQDGPRDDVAPELDEEERDEEEDEDGGDAGIEDVAELDDGEDVLAEVPESEEER